MTVAYDDFRDATFSLGSFGVPPPVAFAPGTEPLYELDANIIQLFISAYF